MTDDNGTNIWRCSLCCIRSLKLKRHHGNGHSVFCKLLYKYAICKRNNVSKFITYLFIRGSFARMVGKSTSLTRNLVQDVFGTERCIFFIIFRTCRERQDAFHRQEIRFSADFWIAGRWRRWEWWRPGGVPGPAGFRSVILGQQHEPSIESGAAYTAVPASLPRDGAATPGEAALLRPGLHGFTFDGFVYVDTVWSRRSHREGCSGIARKVQYVFTCSYWTNAKAKITSVIIYL